MSEIASIFRSTAPTIHTVQSHTITISLPLLSAVMEFFFICQIWGVPRGFLPTQKFLSPVDLQA